ncbi:hypothetical protein BH09BAC2_BH09BAC2_01600 [soil metagenome]
MKQINKTILIFLFTAAVIAGGCNATKKNNCGCPNKRGLVGY